MKSKSLCFLIALIVFSSVNSQIATSKIMFDKISKIDSAYRCINVELSLNINDSSKLHFPILNNTSFSFPPCKNYYRLMIGDKYMYITADSTLVITDSLMAIKVLLYQFLLEYNSQYQVTNFYNRNSKVQVSDTTKLP
jgi:hypothetical protein